MSGVGPQGTIIMSWPETADGDVFRRLQSSQFDFSSAHEIDFNVDFEDWPPPTEAVRWLEKEFKEVTEYPPMNDFNGYLQFKIIGKLNYDFIVSTQDRVSSAMAQFGGICESWGVLHGPPN
jgi:hypothetical protein